MTMVCKKLNNLRFNDKLADILEKKIKIKVINETEAYNIFSYSQIENLDDMFSISNSVLDNSASNYSVSSNSSLPMLLDNQFTHNDLYDNSKYDRILLKINRHQKITDDAHKEMLKIQYLIDVSKLTIQYGYQNHYMVPSDYCKNQRKLLSYNSESYSNILSVINNYLSGILEEDIINNFVDHMLYLVNAKDDNIRELVPYIDSNIMLDTFRKLSEHKFAGSSQLLNMYKYVEARNRYSNMLVVSSIENIKTIIIRNRNNDVSNLKYYIESCSDDINNLLFIMNHNYKELYDIIYALIDNKNVRLDGNNDEKLLKIVLNIKYYLPYHFEQLKYLIVHIEPKDLIKIIIKNKENDIFNNYYLPYIMSELNNIINNGLKYRCKCPNNCSYNKSWYSFTGMNGYITNFFPYMWEDDKIQCIKRLSYNYDINIFDGSILNYMNLGSKINKYDISFLNRYREIEMDDEFKFSKKLLIE